MNKKIIFILPGRHGKQAFLKGIMFLASELLQQAGLSNAAKTATLSHSTKTQSIPLGPEGTRKEGFYTKLSTE